MRRFELFLLKDWQYKLLSLFIGITLWFFLNLGDRVPISTEKAVEVYNQRSGYDYRLERKRVKLRLRIMERFVSEEMLERVIAGVNVKGLEEGEYILKVEVKNLPKFLVSVDRVEPEYVKLKVVRAPEGGK